MKKTIEDYRREYKDVTDKKPAVRWNIKTLQKKILDAQILKAGHAQLDKSKSQPTSYQEVKPEFEALAGDEQPKILPAEAVEPEERRGGPREGAGRPAGQTDRRARCEHLMSLDVPDLAVGVAVDVINSSLTQLTGVGLDDSPVSSIDLSNFPHGSKSIALGITKLLYYWFPSIEGRTDLVTLHLESLIMIVNPLRERAKRIFNLRKQKESEVKNAKENIGQREVRDTADTADTAAPAAPAATAAPARSRGKKRSARSRSHAK